MSYGLMVYSVDINKLTSICGSQDFLDNNLFYPCSINFLTEEVNSHLTNAGTTLDMGNLIYQSSPVKFPSPDDFPLYGYWRPEDVAANIQPLNTYNDKTP